MKPKKPLTESDYCEEAYRIWREALVSGDALAIAQAEEYLNRRLTKYARSVVYLTLRRAYPDLVTTIVSQAFLKAATFRGESRFGTWFYRLAVNVCLDEIKRQRRRRECSLDFLEEGSFLDSRGLRHSMNRNSSAEAVEANVLLEHLLRQLSSADQLLLQLKLEGHTNEAIGTVLGLRREGVKTRWKALKRQLLELNGDELWRS